MQNAIETPLRIFFCPARGQMRTTSYTNAAFPYETAAPLSYTQGAKYSVALGDYAGCNGAIVGDIPGTGAIVSQSSGRYTVSTTSDIKDGTPYTLLLSEKAANPRTGTITNEDDMGYFAGYGPTPGTFKAGTTIGLNYNSVRFTGTTTLPILPLRDYEVTGPTGGAFGSAHVGAFNGLMADGSVRKISYSITPNVFVALGTIAGNEIISEADLNF
jgi:prepilin-type processing-associated H-X9-DG protein